MLDMSYEMSEVFVRLVGTNYFHIKAENEVLLLLWCPQAMTKSIRQNFAKKCRNTSVFTISLTKVERTNTLTQTVGKNRRKVWDHSRRRREEVQEYAHCLLVRNSDCIRIEAIATIVIIAGIAGRY